MMVSRIVVARWDWSRVSQLLLRCHSTGQVLRTAAVLAQILASDDHSQGDEGDDDADGHHNDDDNVLEDVLNIVGPGDPGHTVTVITERRHVQPGRGRRRRKIKHWRSTQVLITIISHGLEYLIVVFILWQESVGLHVFCWEWRW